jgi:serine/threonine-protein kinase
VVVPDALERVVKKLLEKDPNARYPDAAAVVAALESAMPASATATPEPDHGDLPITVLGMRPDTDSPAPDVPPAAAEVPPVRPYTPKLLGRPAREPGDKSRIWMGVAAVSVLVAAASLLARPAAAPVPTSPQLASSVIASGPPSSAPAPRSAPATSPTAAVVPARAGADPLAAMNAASSRGETVAAARALLELASKDGKRLHDLEVQEAAGRVTERAFAVGGPDADRLATMLSSELGTDGLDVLYETAQLGAPGSTRAMSLLSHPDILAKATPAMRIAFELRRASCQHKPNLFPRAAQHGDARTLTLLNALQPPACDPISGACCFRKHGELDKAVEAIRQRTGL